jgi:hypothetical protein
VEVDPLASMRCWAIGIELGGHLFEVPPLPAVEWWPVLTSVDPTLVLDMVESSSGIDLDEMILSGELSGSDLDQALLDAIEAATGRPPQAAYVLASVAALQWPSIGGRMAERGFRWDVMPIGAALDAIYSIVVGALPEKSEDGKRKPREEFLALLDRPMPGQPLDRDKMVSQFETIAGPRPTGGVIAKTGEIPTGGVRSSAARSGSEPPRTPPRRQQRRRAVRSSAPRPRP